MTTNWKITAGKATVSRKQDPGLSRIAGDSAGFGKNNCCNSSAKHFQFIYLYKTAKMQPETLNFKPTTPDCISYTLNFKPGTLNCVPGTLNSELGALNPEPGTPNCGSLPLNPLKGTLRRSLTWNSFPCTSGTFSGSSTLNFKPETLNCAPGTRNPEPETCNMEHETLNLKL